MKLEHEATLGDAGVTSRTPPRALAASPDGRLLWAATDEGLACWEVATWRARPRRKMPPLDALTVSDDGVLAAGHSLVRVDGVSGKLTVEPLYEWDGWRGSRRDGSVCGVTLHPLRVLRSASGEIATRWAAGRWSFHRLRGAIEGGRLALAPGGERVLSWRATGLARVLASPDWEALGERACDAPITAACWLGDDRVVLATVDGAVRCWSASLDRVVWSAPSHGDVRTLAASPDGAAVLVGASEASALLDADTGRERVAFPHAVTAPAAVGVGGAWVAFAGERGGLRVLDASSPRELAGDDLVAGAVTSLHWAAGGRTLVSASTDDPCVRLWDVSSRECAHAFEVPPGATAHALSPDGRRFATASRGEVRLWEVESGAELAAWSSNLSPRALAWSPDGELLAACGARDGVAAAVCFDGALRVRWERADAGWGEARAVAWSARGTLARVAFTSGVVAFATTGEVDPSEGLDCRVWYDARDAWKRVVEVALLDGRGALTVGETAGGFFPNRTAVRVVAWRPPSPLTPWSVNVPRPGPLAVDAAGRWCALGLPGRVSVWDLKERRHAGNAALASRDDEVTAVAFSHDGARLAAGTRQGLARVWRLAE